MPDTSGDKPKIIVDEDWKSQVQKEKEALQTPPASEPPASPAAAAKDGPSDEGPLEYPPATLPVLLSTLAAQAMIGMGQIPHPASNKPEVDLGAARHFIDTLEMLEQKTADNRTPEESALLEQVLHELRMAFVSVSR